jgi:hypothetical protein
MCDPFHVSQLPCRDPALLHPCWCKIYASMHVKLGMGMGILPATQVIGVSAAKTQSDTCTLQTTPFIRHESWRS